MQIYDISTCLKKLLQIAKHCLSADKFSILERRLLVKSQLTQRTYLEVLARLCENSALGDSEIFNNVAKELIFSYNNINTRRTYYYAVKFIASILGYELDIFSEELKFKAEESMKTGNTFTLNEVERFIDATLEILKKGEPIEIFSYEIYPEEFLKLILLTTLYGVRRGEVYIASSKDVSFDEQTIFIRSLKKSVQRKHFIPTDLVDLFRIAFKTDRKPPDARYLNDMFIYLHAKAEVKRVKRRNIHSIRKTVASQLLMQGHNPVFVNDFLRWRGGGTMLSFYANMDPIYIDVEIFKKHPLLEIWKEKVNKE